MSNKSLLITLTLTLSLIGCSSPTKFSGDAKIDGGPAQCEKICGNWSMELAGMVALGEYTNGCICKKRGANLSMVEAVNPILMSSVGAGGVIGKMAHEQPERSVSSDVGQAILEIITLPLR